MNGKAYEQVKLLLWDWPGLVPVCNWDIWMLSPVRSLSSFGHVKFSEGLHNTGEALGAGTFPVIQPVPLGMLLQNDKRSERQFQIRTYTVPSY